MRALFIVTIVILFAATSSCFANAKRLVSEKYYTGSTTCHLCYSCDTTTCPPSNFSLISGEIGKCTKWTRFSTNEVFYIRFDGHNNYFIWGKTYASNDTTCSSAVSSSWNFNYPLDACFTTNASIGDSRFITLSTGKVAVELVKICIVVLLAFFIIS